MDHSGELRALLAKVVEAEGLVWNDPKSERLKLLFRVIQNKTLFTLLAGDFEELERNHPAYIQCIRGIHQECKIDLDSEPNKLDVASRLDRMRESIQESLAHIDSSGSQ